ncbi:MAG: hypothetical protein ACK53C_08930, partial [Pseudomonadota bacterium]
MLCLVLRFDDEFESLFAKLLGPVDGTVLTLLDAESRERLAPPGQFSRLRAATICDGSSFTGSRARAGRSTAARSRKAWRASARTSGRSSSVAART